MHTPKFLRAAIGFTLSELLIALAILGVIATFTIPKVLQGQRNDKFNAQGKEAAAMLIGAYNAYRLNTTPTSALLPRDLTPYMNYIGIDSTSLIDQRHGATSASCVTSNCLKLHHGGRLRPSLCNMGGTSNTNVISFLFDPDGVYSGTTDGIGKSIDFILYYDGRISTVENPIAGTIACAVPQAPVADADPEWFSWDN